MHEQPGEPGDQAAHFDRPTVGHGFGAADRGHGAFVPIFEGGPCGCMGSGQLALDDLCDVAAHLHGGRRDSGDGPAILAHDEGHVTNSKDFRKPRDTQVRVHFHTADSIKFYSEVLGERCRRDASRPNDIVGLDHFAAFQFDFPGRNGFNPCGSANMDAEVAELFRGALSQIGRHMGKDDGRSLDQDDFGNARINSAKVLAKYKPRQFRKGAGKFNSSRAAAYDNNRQQPVANAGIFFCLGPFEGKQDIISNAQGIIQGLQAGSELFPFGMAEVRGATSQGHNKVVVMERTVAQENGFAAKVDLEDLLH